MNLTSISWELADTTVNLDWHSDSAVYRHYESDSWHPAFLSLGKTLDECAKKYRGFCRKYKPQPKSEKRSHWGSRMLAGMKVEAKPAKKRSSPGQMSLPWNQWNQCQVSESPFVQEVAERFVKANSYNSE
jgi:putative transposase